MPSGDFHIWHCLAIATSSQSLWGAGNETTSQSTKPLTNADRPPRICSTAHPLHTCTRPPPLRKNLHSIIVQTRNTEKEQEIYFLVKNTFWRSPSRPDIPFSIPPHTPPSPGGTRNKRATWNSSQFQGAQNHIHRFATYIWVLEFMRGIFDDVIAAESHIVHVVIFF